MANIQQATAHLEQIIEDGSDLIKSIEDTKNIDSIKEVLQRLVSEAEMGILALT